MQPASIINCVECGGKAHLISFAPPDREYEPGDQLIYRCEDCLERFDIVHDDVEEPDAFSARDV